MDGRAIFAHLIANMEIDNGTDYEATEEEVQAGAMLCEVLRDVGYFQDDPNSMYGSFWTAVAGDYDTAMEYFKNHPAYINLNNILEHIFVEG